MRLALLLVVLASSLSPLVAQEDRSPFDAPQVVMLPTMSMTTIGDFDADGRPDAAGWFWAYARRYDTVRVNLVQNRTSGLVNGWGYNEPNTGGQNTSWDVAAGDFDGAAGDELAYAFDGDVTAVTFRRTPVPSGTHLRLDQFIKWTEPFAVQDLEFVDVDRDGGKDLVLIGGELKVYRYTGTAFALMTSLPLAGEMLMVADMDGDGFDDLVVPTAGGFQIVRYQSGALQTIATPAHGVASNESPMPVAGDIDNDGDADLVVFTGGGEYVTLRNAGGASFTVEPRAQGGPATGLADLDGDGDLDGVCCGSGGPAPATNTGHSTFHIAMNQGLGRFAPAYTVTGLGAFRLAGAVDFDLDGDNDLVAGRCIWWNRGQWKVDPQPDVAVVPPQPITCSDPDRDGDPDLPLLGGLRLANDGAGGFGVVSPVMPDAPPGTTWEGEGYRGDFDGDGDEDRIVCHMESGAVLGMRLLRNTGGGDYVDGGYALQAGATFVQPLPADGWERTHVVADVDADGDLDILQGTPTAPFDTTVWLNDGNGWFAAGPTHAGIGVPKRMAHLDGDTHLDLVTSLHVCWGDGAGGFTVGPPLGPGVRPTDSHVAIGDIDNDVDLDVAFFAIDRSTVYILVNQGNRTLDQYARRTLHPDVSRAHGVDLHDFDDDGFLDYLVWPSSYHEGEFSAHIMFGGAPARYATQIADVRGPLTDVDGDGDMDAIGAWITRGGRHVPMDGYRLQYGAPSASAGGFEPKLGASGDLEEGGTVSLMVRGAPGGAPVALGLGAYPVLAFDWPLPGLVGFVGGLVAVVPTVADGVLGEEGTGDVTLPVVLPVGMAGQTVFLQAWTFDVAGAELLHTGGLALSFR